MESTTSAKNQPCVETGKSKPSQIPRALSLIRKGANKFYSLCLCATYQQMCHPGMAFMQHRSSPKPNQGKQHSCNLVRSVCPKKWEQNQDSKQPSSPSFGKQDNKPSKSTKTPKAVKPVSNNKKLLCRPSPYSYSTKNVNNLVVLFLWFKSTNSRCTLQPTQQSRIPVRRCQSVTLIVERIALLESEEMELEERLRIVRNQLENLKFLRTNQTFIDRMNQTSNQKMSKIEEEPSVSPSSAYLRPLRPRVFSVNDDIQSSHWFSFCLADFCSV